MVKPLATPIKGKSDWRQYKAIELDNGVICLLINDKESKTTAMSSVVNVGAAADPRSLSGLAHFCEHMCFLGSEKYPGENEYKRYLSAHGGRCNASTSMHLTNYKFEVLADHAEKAVDIFSNFFIAPLFTRSGTAREVQAVDSENSKNLTADGRRRLQILKQLADPNHYYSKFSTGNSKTLMTNNDDEVQYMRDALLAFHRKHYKASNMTVVIAGPQSLDILEEWIVSRFSKMPNKEFPSLSSAGNEEEKLSMTNNVEQLINDAAEDAPDNRYDTPAPPYKSAFKSSLQNGQWPVLLTTKPLRSMRKLVMMFPIPSDQKIPDQAPSSFLSHLLGHEGAGSVFAVLQNHGLLSSLSAGPRTKAPDFTLFQIDMGLTEQGEKDWRVVVDLVFAYCRLLIGEAIKERSGKSNELHRIWGEMSQLDKMFFHQSSPGSAYSYAPNLGERVILYGTESCLSAGSMLNENENTFSLEDVHKVMEMLNPKNCIIERCSEVAWKEIEEQSKGGTSSSTTTTTTEGMESSFGKQTEEWYGVDFYLSRIESDTIKSWEGKGSDAVGGGGGVADGDKSISSSELHLPVANRYIPRSLDLCDELPEEAKKASRIEKPIDPPNLLVDDNFGRLYHRLDDRYALPQSSLNLLIRNGKVQYTKKDDDDDNDCGGGGSWKYNPESVLYSSMISGIFNEAMAQETYDADLAGLYWSIGLGPSGIRFNFFGFSDRLPDLAETILEEFMSGKFLQQSFFESTKDRVIRGLKSYFESRRADSHAVYYRDALLASSDNGIEESLHIATAADFETVKEHYKDVIRNNEIFLECLFTGNVSSSEAKNFYSKASSILQETSKPEQSNSDVIDSSTLIFPAASLERRIVPGDDVELHFASKNPEEENGAVVMSYQSSIPAFKGDGLSHPLGLKSTSAIRLLCHMLREPLFDELRTKQTLGYIVSAYYELGYSSRSATLPTSATSTIANQSEPLPSASGPLTCPVDFITICILSRKKSPPDIKERIDEFLQVFRKSLASMPESEIRDHAEALSTKLLKPIQKLSTEANSHFSTIQRYGPEVFYSNGSGNAGESPNLPWRSVETLAKSIQSLERKDLLESWDRVVNSSDRCRVVSCVYGNTFPLNGSTTGKPSQARTTTNVINNNFGSLLQKRKNMPIYDDRATTTAVTRSRRYYSSFLRTIGQTSPSVQSRLWTIVGVGVLGAGVVGLGIAARNHYKMRSTRR